MMAPVIPCLPLNLWFTYPYVGMPDNCHKPQRDNAVRRAGHRTLSDTSSGDLARGLLAIGSALPTLAQINAVMATVAAVGGAALVVVRLWLILTEWHCGRRIRTGRCPLAGDGTCES
jgi:hypothetical protein